MKTKPHKSCTLTKLLMLSLLAATGLSGCGMARETTTAETLAPTQAPPAYYFPFDLTPEEGQPVLELAKYVDKLPVQKYDRRCPTSVNKLEVITSGPVQDNLSYNTKYRFWNGSDEDDFAFKETNDNNTELGGVQTGNLYLYYKYQVKISYIGDIRNAFYGQMISKDLLPLEAHDADLCFKSADPRNDVVGQIWRVNKDEPFVEFKKKYPTLKVDNQNLTWIGFTGGGAGFMGVGYENKKQYVMIYAGACNRITHLKVFKIEYPPNSKPIMSEVTDLKKEVKSFTYLPNP